MAAEEVHALPIVKIHSNGIFVPNPLVYFDANITTVEDIDFSVMSCNEFITYVQKVTKRMCIVVYYCLPEESLSKGLKGIQNECDYHEFIEVAYGNNRSVDVYVDHMDEPVFDWIENEDPDSDNEVDLDEDVDSHLSDNEQCDHEPEDGVVSCKISVNDPFLNKLFAKKNDDFCEKRDAKPVYPVYDDTKAWDEMEPALGMKFASPSDLKWLLSNYAVHYGYDLWFERNEKNRILVKCCKDKTPTCPFRLWASWMKNERTFQIKTLKGTHNCSRAFKLGSIVTYKWIGRQFVKEFLETPKISLRKMKSEISKKINIIVSIGQCRNAKKYALSEIEGTLTEHYAKLWEYGAEILRSNPGSHVEVGLDPQPDGTTIFSKFYVCFKRIVDGWKEGCRRVIGLDGCFLKGICRGELLTAVGRDANNSMYPIAWAVVNVESKVTWKWFLDNLMEDIEGGQGGGLTLLSDGHKGLIEAIKERVPNAEHRLCCRHILGNFHKRFKGENFIKPFWKVVKAGTEAHFKSAMEEIKNIDNRAYEYLMERDPKTFCRAYFQEGADCDAVENRVSESFNGADPVLEARKKPIIAMLEDIRVYVMERLYVHNRKGIEWNLRICPAIRRRIEKLKMIQRFWNVYVSGYQKFEVIQGSERYGVDLSKRECGCRIWQLAGIPCVHGIAAISSLNLDAENYVSNYFTTESHLKCYAYTINPLNDSSQWPTNTDIGHTPLPPKRKRLPGRPTIKRKRDEAERTLTGKSKVSRRGDLQMCTLCHVHGHNKSKCPTRSTTQGPAAGPSGTTNQGPGPGPSGTTTQGPAVGPSGTTNQGPGPGPSGTTTQGSSKVAQVSSDVDAQTTQGSGSGCRPSPGKKKKAASGGRTRRPSERQLKIQLSKVVVPKDGRGCSNDKPVEL